MSEEFLEQKAKEAQKIIDEVYQRKRKKQEELQKNEAFSLLGKFFKGHTSCADDNPVEIYRVIGKAWSDSVSVEKFFYAHSGHYAVALTSFHQLIDVQFLEEITEAEYYQEVVRFLKKINAIQVITAEQDH